MARRSRRTPLALSLLVALTIAVAAAQAGRREAAVNLLENGDAEAGIPAADDVAVVVPFAWDTTGSFTSVKYGSRGLPTAGQAPPNAGNSLFAGGPGSGVASATQPVDVSAHGADIDAGRRRAALSADLGGWEGQADAATVQATFVDVSGAPLGSVAIGPVTPTDRGSQTGFVHRVGTAKVPAGTRSIVVVITARRANGNYNDGYADNVTLTLASAAPGKQVGLARVTINQYLNRYRPNTAVLKDGAVVTFCNKNEWPVHPFWLKTTLNETFSKRLKPGECAKVRVHNPTPEPIAVKIYDALHSQVRGILRVLPRG
jgi:hypothetical protein